MKTMPKAIFTDPWDELSKEEQDQALQHLGWNRASDRDWLEKP